MNERETRAMAAEVLAAVAPEADLAQVSDDEDLREALDLDSMDFMNFVIGLAERSRRQIPDADTRRLYTMRALVSYFAT